MNFVYYVRNKETRQVLNKKLNWSKNIFSYGLMEFESEENATAAIPEGIDCEILKLNKVDKNVVIEAKFCIKNIFTNRFYLDKNDLFTLKSYLLPEVASFTSEDEAIAKAESLNLDLDSIKIIILPKNEEK